MEVATAYLDAVAEAARRVDFKVLSGLLDRLVQAYREDALVCLIGNGGSAAAASHFAEDLCKGALADDCSKRFRALSLTDNTPFITAIANDLSYDDIFLFQVRQFARRGDLLIAISGSGNSPNVLKAVVHAREQGIATAAFTGFDGGRLGPLADWHIHVPLHDMCQTEAVHGLLMHLIVDLLRPRLAQATGAPPGRGR